MKVRGLALILIYVIVAFTIWLTATHAMSWGNDALAPVLPIIAVVLLSLLVVFYEEW